MGAILRWFYDDGTRHRAYLRHGDEPEPEQIELVISAGDWQAAVPVTADTALEDYTEQRLTELARELRAEPRESRRVLEPARGG